MTPVADRNTAFQSRSLIQLAWDSTSLGEFKTCPRKYFYSIIMGLRPRVDSIDLRFGILIHEAIEQYHKDRFAGSDHELALRLAVHSAMMKTWDHERGRPETLDDPLKNRLTLVRTLVWYLDKWKEDTEEIPRLANGKPAVELSFRFDTQLRSTSGEAFLLCGHMDKIRRLGGVPYVGDVKTTRYQLNQDYFDMFSPDNQFSTYCLAAKVVFGIETKGIILDAIQVGANFARFHRQLIPRSEASLEEWFEDLEYWLRLAESCALEKKWPQNDKSCNQYRGCRFRGVCSRSPAQREAYLEANFTQVVWDPLRIRGDY